MLCTVLLNILMLRFFAQSMGLYGASKATVYNFAITYIESILIGNLIFSEEIQMKKLIAMVIIILGVWLISQSKEKAETNLKKIN